MAALGALTIATTSLQLGPPVRSDRTQSGSDRFQPGIHMVDENDGGGGNQTRVFDSSVRRERRRSTAAADERGSTGGPTGND